ncbi:MAG: hypothetical protein ACI8RD_008680 [Bacillariaceae sp.]|jgi:hypothetical protein
MSVGKQANGIVGYCSVSIPPMVVQTKYNVGSAQIIATVIFSPLIIPLAMTDDAYDQAIRKKTY